MSNSLVEIYRSHKSDSRAMYDFLQDREHSIADDLWKSAGGHWSEASITKFRQIAVQKLMERSPAEDSSSLNQAWVQIIRDFHTGYWGEKTLARKEEKPKTEEQKITREMFLYVWVATQALIVTKTIALYFGINSVIDQDDSGKIWLYVTLAFTACSLTWFAYSQTKKHNQRDQENSK